MKNVLVRLMKVILASLIITASVAAQAQLTNNAEVEFRALAMRINQKVAGGQNQESDFRPELNYLDQLIAEQHGVNPEEAAVLTVRKAALYLQVFDEPNKAENIMAELKRDYPQTIPGQSADKILARLERQAALTATRPVLGTGSPFPDFAVTDLAGQPLSVSRFRGRVVLLDFWATWCAPCRAELPNVIATYNKHHASGFEIIGVSLDSDRSTLTSFLRQNAAMSWPEYFDGGGPTNKLAVKYGVQSIPIDVLIGRDGKIIGTELYGAGLEEAVSKALATQ